MTEARSPAAWQTLRKSLGGYWLRLAPPAVLACLTAVAEVVTLMSLVPLIAAISAKGAKVYEATLPVLGTSLTLSVGQLLALCAVVAVCRFVCQVSTAYVNARVTSGFEARQRQRIFDAYARASWERQSQEPPAQLHTLLITQVDGATRSVSNLVLGLASLVSFLVLTCSALVVDWASALAILVLGGVLFLVTRPLSQLARQQSHARLKAYYSYLHQINQAGQMGRELRVFHVIQAFGAQITRLAWQLYRFRLLNSLLAGLVPALYQNVSLLLILGGLALVHFSGFAQPEALVVVVLLLIRSMIYTQNFQIVFHNVYEGLANMEMIEAAVDRYRAAAIDLDRGQPVGRIDSLEFDHVSFAYLPDEPVLRQLSFRVERGEVIGVVGPSGSGKSTLMQLLLRLRNPTSGTMLANDQPVERFSLGSWYQRVAFVPQETLLFDDSIANSIRFFRPQFTEEQIKQAAREAGIHDEVVGFARGYETPVGANGSNLSGGQRQRLCIARALVGQPDVIVFDEPTSALDAHAEQTVVRTLESLRGRATVFIIAHRLSTLNICDRVLVLRHGELQAFDSPQNLAENDSYYSEALRLLRAGAE